ncbi:MAG: Flp pilus assembly complex ATPase component TadA, partial [Lentisphaeria bacterium]|nr:Flp pilus assembly complex ATPase component TadA [Lentisphaeria bacterium]
MDALDGLRYVLNRDVEAVISPQEQIQKVMDRYYGTLTDSVNTLLNGMETGNLEQVEDADSGNEASGDDAPIIRLVYLLITEAYKMKASDIHLEPLERRFRVRYRIDGVLREMESPPKYLQSNIISRIKIMSRMDLSEKRIPQDGRIQVMVQGVSIDLRVSDIHTTHGESIVMRILD